MREIEMSPVGVEILIQKNIIHIGDSAEILKTFPDLCVDLSIQSPPYDNLRMYNGYTFDFETIAHQLYRVTKQGGVCVWIVGDATINGSETLTSFKQALYFREIGFNVETMIYEKANPLPRFKSPRYTNAFEYMFVFSKGQPSTFNPIKEPSRSFGKIDKNYNGQRFPNGIHNIKNGVKRVRKEKLLTNIWTYDAANDIERINHPAQFPMSLASDHIKTWSNEGDTVLDCFAGSGTTLKMAKMLSRQYIGIEISPEYVALAEKRLRDLNIREQQGTLWKTQL
jgi:site-specific DNA-methyltransferase (adenine-specific)